MKKSRSYQAKLLNPFYYKKLHKTVSGRFIKKAHSIVKFNQAAKVLPPDLISPIKKLSHLKFDPLKFYLVEMLDEYLTINQLIEENAADELFDYWSESEYAKTFMQKINKTSDVIKSSKSCQQILLNQLLAFNKVHLGNSNKPPKDYRPIKEIGDYLDEKKRLHHHDFGSVRSLDLEKGIYPFLSFLTSDSKNQTKHLKKISKALELIKNYSPLSYKAFCDFTHTIIPLKEKGVVSYSTSKLPGYSLINVYDRDFIDLLDDLIHENGHHYLNYFLYTKPLIHEDSEKIFYSPWRKQLRPIRGIYHAVFTFFWGMNLFSDLDSSIQKDKINFFKLSKSEKIKIKKRYLEEFLMIKFSVDDLKVAYKLGKVTAAGMELVLELEKLMNSSQKNYQLKKKELAKISSSSFKEINQLEVHLNKMAKTYRFKV